jgi:hypothetical protein
LYSKCSPSALERMDEWVRLKYKIVMYTFIVVLILVYYVHKTCCGYPQIMIREYFMKCVDTHLVVHSEKDAVQCGVVQMHIVNTVKWPLWTWLYMWLLYCLVTTWSILKWVQIINLFWIWESERGGGYYCNRCHCATFRGITSIIIRWDSR